MPIVDPEPRSSSADVTAQPPQASMCWHMAVRHEGAWEPGQGWDALQSSCDPGAYLTLASRTAARLCSVCCRMSLRSLHSIRAATIFTGLIMQAHCGQAKHLVGLELVSACTGWPLVMSEEGHSPLLAGRYAEACCHSIKQTLQSSVAPVKA